MAVIDIQTLNASLSQAKARWQPRQTPQANLNAADKRALLGVVGLDRRTGRPTGFRAQAPARDMVAVPGRLIAGGGVAGSGVLGNGVFGLYLKDILLTGNVSYE